jgi:HPr kinase/phosphorylase
MSSTSDSQTLHATAVAVDARAALIRGPSGSGKSSLALQLIALGASLVSDDRVCIQRNEDGLMVQAPDRLRGLIEARGVGILAVPMVSCAKLHLIVDMAQTEDHRLPPWREETLLTSRVPVVRKSDAPHFPAALMLYLKLGRVD